MNDYEAVREQVEAWKQANPTLKIAEIVEEPCRSGHIPMIHCPFHDDGNPSMAVYEDGFHCFACGWHGDTASFIMELNGWDFRQFVDFIGQYPVNPNVPQHVKDRPLHRREQPAIDRSQVESWAYRGKERWAYWQAQHIYPSTLEYFGVGWTGQRYTIPWFYRDVVTAVKLRRCEELTPHIEPKYIALKGSHFSQPYNIDAVMLAPKEREHVLIVEDEKSVWAAHQCGLAAISFPANGFRSEWVMYLSFVPRITIIADADDAGRESAQKIRNWIRRARIVEANAFYPDGRPATDLFDLHAAGIDIVDYIDTHLDTGD